MYVCVYIYVYRTSHVPKSGENATHASGKVNPPWRIRFLTTVALTNSIWSLGVVLVVSAPENGGFMPQHAPEFHFSLPPTVFSLRKSRKQGMVLILVVKTKFWDRVEQKKIPSISHSGSRPLQQSGITILISKKIIDIRLNKD